MGPEPHRVERLGGGGAPHVDRKHGEPLAVGLEMMRAEALQYDHLPGDEWGLLDVFAEAHDAAALPGEDVRDAHGGVNVVRLIGRVWWDAQELERGVSGALGREHLLRGAAVHVGQVCAARER